MDGIHTGFARDAQYVVDEEVCLDRPLVAADEIGFVGFRPVQGETILLGVDRHGAQAELEAALMTRMAISPRLATRILRIRCDITTFTLEFARRNRFHHTGVARSWQRHEKCYMTSLGQSGVAAETLRRG